MAVENISNIIDTLRAGGSVHVKEGRLEADGLGTRMVKWLCPFYARKKDLEVTDFFILRLNDQIDHLPEATTPIGTAPAVKQTLDAANLFIKKAAFGSLFKRGQMHRQSKQIRRVGAMARISENHGIGIKHLKDNTAFMDAVQANAWHYKVGKTAADRGLGFHYNATRGDRGDIDVVLPDGENSVDEHGHVSGTLAPWKTLMEENSSKSKMQLMAYGWGETHELERPAPTAIQSVPMDQIEMEEDDVTPKVKLTVTTVHPSYCLANLGLGTFGHSYVEAFKPLLDADGAVRTDNDGNALVEVYNFGYNLKDVQFPDFARDLNRPRSHISEQISLKTWENTQDYVSGVTKALRLLNAGEDVPMDLDGYYDDARRLQCLTCANFASMVFEQATAKKISARNTVARIIAPKPLLRGIDWFADTFLPEFVRKVTRPMMRPIRFFTRGYFPSNMVNAQAR